MLAGKELMILRDFRPESGEVNCAYVSDDGIGGRVDVNDER